ncbi:unnamed protein product, partial [Polarella glacialis]
SQEVVSKMLGQVKGFGNHAGVLIEPSQSAGTQEGESQNSNPEVTPEEAERLEREEAQSTYLQHYEDTSATSSKIKRMLSNMSATSSPSKTKKPKPESRSYLHMAAPVVFESPILDRSGSARFESEFDEVGTAILSL